MIDPWGADEEKSTGKSMGSEKLFQYEAGI